MTRRPGLSLLEILMTIFIMALGLLGILTLFPLAASQMAIAVREDRSAQAASQADAFFRSYWKTQVAEPGNATATVQEPFYAALMNPGGGLATPGTDEVSYPVFVDPMGYFARSTAGASQVWLGDGGVTFVPRRSLSIVTSNPSNLYSMRLCSLPDSLSYNDDGQPVTPGSGITEREWRYNWAWVVQRPSNRNFSAATMTVVVYDKRPPLFTPVGAESVFLNSVTFNPTSTTLVVPGVPDVKPGGWVMDATITPGTAIRQANFYQVVSVTPNGANTILELQVPIKTRSDNSNTSYNGTLVVLRGVSGVYSRPSLGN